MLIKIRNKICKYFAPLFFYFFRIFKIKNNKIVIVNYSGKGYGDNAKYIVDELIKKNIFDIVWSTKDRDSLPIGVRAVNIFSLKWIYELSTAKIWINNSRFKLYVKKRKNQFYIQTWHSSLRLKKIELDAIEKLPDYYKKMIIDDSKKIDLMISGCDFSYNTYKNSFAYNGEIAKIGTPRFDLFFNEKKMKEYNRKIRSKYKIDMKKKILLYAPTFRTWGDSSKCPLNLEAFEKKLPSEYILLVRSHPNITLKFDEIDNRIIDVTLYPDMQELICAADFLITDYSGCCFDMMITRKPCVIFAPDLDEYLKRERNLYFTYDELPFELTTKESELLDKIINFKINEYVSNIEEFYKFIGMYENGNASQELCKIIENIVLKNSGVI